MARDNPAGSAPSLVEYAQRLCTERLTAYSAARHDVEEHANLEELALGGGYAYRQVAELIQNAADAVSEDAAQGVTNRIEILADRYGLWAANTGAPVDEAGVRALLNAASSNKRASQIGRFGLGFKSLLLLGGNIDVISRPVWLHFDPAATRDRIRSHLGLAADAPAPGLRLADAGEWAEGLADIPQAQKFEWATTIVFASIESQAARLAIYREIREFPEEFLLFLPCDVELVLVVGDTRRHLRRRTDDDGCVVLEDVADRSSIPQRWRVFETVASIHDKAAIEDARQIHYRQAVPVIWAAPVGAPQQSRMFKETRTGKFFAFFPTSTESRAHGIINAPWKLNNDRTALVPGAWNNALMEEAAKLIAARITELGSADDPGAVLDGFPREIRSESDPAAPLVRSMWSLLTDAPVIPNCDGEYLSGSELLRHPTDTAAMAAAWSSLAPPEDCVAHIHPTCLATPARASRLNALAGRLKDRAKSTPALQKSVPFDWLEKTATTDVDAAKDVIRLVNDFAQQEKGVWWEFNRPKLRVIVTSEDTLEAAANVVLGDHPEPPLRAVHPRLASDREVRKILQENFHVRDKSEVKVIDHVDARIDEATRTGDWTPVWALLRGLPFDDACRIVRRRPIRVRTLGGWAGRESAYRKGELVTDQLIASVSDENRAAAAAMIVDDKWHARDHALLDEMGIEPNPDPSWRETSVPDAPDTAAQQWLADWRDEWRDKYFVHLGCRVERGQLLPAGFSMPHGWEWLLFAEGAQRQHVTHWLMEALEIADDDEFGSVEFHHLNRFAYQPEEYPHPAWSLLCDRGELAQKDVALPFAALLTEDMADRAALLPSLRAWELALSKLESAGGGWYSEEDAGECWQKWLEYASREECEPHELAQFYEKAAAAGAVPQEVCSPSGPTGLADVYVSVSPRDAELANEAGLPTVVLGKTAAALWVGAGARDLNAFRTTEWDDGEPEIIRLAEFEPTFSEILKPAAVQNACVSLVTSLRQKLGGQTLPVAWLLHDDIVLVDEADFRARGWTEQMCLLVEAAAAAGWVESEDPLAAILESGPAARRRLVAAEPDLPSRLVKAVGDANVLLKLFEPELHVRLRRNMQRTAELALRMFGPALLAIKVIKEAMESQGLAPPKSWSGTAAADFVAAIGFPPEFAVAPQRRREAELSVSGPIPINPLHDFQEEVVANLDSLLADGSKKRRRAVISLPTGAGKTRVAAEMAVTRILRQPGQNRVLLWVAQSDELCEQAVQCFRQLWANMGIEDEPLRIVRYWGSQTNPKAPEQDAPVVVVATIQTLDSRMGQPGTEWVRSPALVVIDECHHALTTSYTSIFRWLKPSGDGDREPPVIGLSATPFRGRNSEETQALARRFDGRLYPVHQSELFEQLQERGVLARFRYTKLEIRERLELSTEEQESLKKFKTLPTGAMERLGRMSDRNDRIVEAIEESEEKSALVFATSVNHAYRLAARLNLEGIRAAAVTGETDRNSRRWFIDAFRRGDIQVLCNHSALTTGFDAPATDLIVIARPVFSPSLYMQMVGRGLRGPVNGGKEECRILTIQDNLDQYTGMLAHHYFEQYYVNG